MLFLSSNCSKLSLKVLCCVHHLVVDMLKDKQLMMVSTKVVDMVAEV